MSHGNLADSRLATLLSKGNRCSSCGELHDSLFDLVADRPDQWPSREPAEPNSAILNSKHVLTEDFCILNGKDYFVRCVLELPIIGITSGRFGYGVWSSLSKSNFEKYVEEFNSEKTLDMGPWFGWFSNRLKGFPDTLNLKCEVSPRVGRQRPLIELEPTDNPLSTAQQNG